MSHIVLSWLYSDQAGGGYLPLLLLLVIRHTSQSHFEAVPGEQVLSAATTIGQDKSGWRLDCLRFWVWERLPGKLRRQPCHSVSEVVCW
jgi:hypothetical protein